MSESLTSEDLLFEYLHAVESGAADGDELLEQLCEEHPHAAAALRAGVATLVEQGLLGGAVVSGRPTTVAGMRIERTLGTGAMGIVYLAHEDSTGQPVALKLIRRGKLIGGGLARFEREVEIARKLDHPGIAALRGAGVEHTQPYCAFDFVPGVSLDVLLQRLATRRPEELSHVDLDPRAPRDARPDSTDPGSWPRRCALLVAEVADALEHAHSRGVRHRDIKPSNIMLHERGHAVLVDFGLGAIEGAETLTRSGTQLGSLLYMAPEQALGERGSIDERSDVYSLGVTLYELLTLRPPYRGEDAASTLALVLAGRALPPRQRNPTIPPALETICLRAMERQSRYRFPTAAAFARDLRRFAEGRSIESRPPGLLRRGREWAALRPALATGLAVGVSLVVAAPLVFAWSENRLARRTRVLNEELATSLAKSQELNTRLEEALAQSKSDAARADRNYGYAREAIVEIVGKVANRSLARTPQMDRVRDQILTSSRALYTELEKERAHDEQILRDVAFLARAHAEILFGMGDDSRAMAAVAAHETAVAHLEAMGLPRQGLLFERAQVAQITGAAQLNALQDEQVVASSGRAIELCDELLAAEPDDVPGLRLSASAHLTMAKALAALDRNEQADESSNLAMSRIEKAVSLAAGDPENQFVRAGVLSGIAEVGVQTRLRDDVLELSRNALAAAELAVRADPGDPRYAAQRAASRLGLLQMLMGQGGDANETLAQLERCRAEYGELVARFPNREDYWNERSTVEACAAQWMRETGDARGAMQSERRRVDLQVQHHLAQPDEDGLRRKAIVALMAGAFNAVSLFDQVPSAARECLDYCDRACALAGKDFEGQGSDHTMRSLKVVVESLAARASGLLRDQGIWAHLQAMEQCLPMTYTEATMATAAYLGAVEYLHATAGEETMDRDRLTAVRGRLVEHLRMVVDSKAMSYAEIAALPGTSLMAGDAEYDALMERFRAQ
ncbi:MAG TPA: serine/threonine-protein kinase [Planctomycetota bacterium]|nr:serine/threonine-protein kinase [Planctomycetota bacterium]